jgi:predicted Zn-dependent peptidase
MNTIQFKYSVGDELVYSFRNINNDTWFISRGKVIKQLYNSENKYVLELKGGQTVTISEECIIFTGSNDAEFRNTAVDILAERIFNWSYNEQQ